MQLIRDTQKNKKNLSINPLRMTSRDLMRSYSIFSRMHQAAKSTNFDQKKALYALQGKFVITDENQHFEWVGSDSAGPCIIILIHGIDKNGVKVATCGHLSAAETPYSVNHMLYHSKIDKITSAYLISGETQENDDTVQLLLRIFAERGFHDVQLNLGNHIKQGAINVKTGDMTNDVAFRMENAGELDTTCMLFYALDLQMSWLTHQERPVLNLSLDARKSEDANKVKQMLLGASLFDEEVISASQEDIHWEPFFSISLLLMSLDILPIDWNLLTFLMTVMNVNDNEVFPHRSEVKLLTYPEWDEAKENMLHPKVSLQEYRLFSKMMRSYDMQPSSSIQNLGGAESEGVDQKGHYGFKPGFLIGKRF